MVTIHGAHWCTYSKRSVFAAMNCSDACLLQARLFFLEFVCMYRSRPPWSRTFPFLLLATAIPWSRSPSTSSSVGAGSCVIFGGNTESEDVVMEQMTLITCMHWSSSAIFQFFDNFIKILNFQNFRRRVDVPIFIFVTSFRSPVDCPVFLNSLYCTGNCNDERGVSFVPN